MPQTEQDQVFSAHSAWITGLREQYAALGSRSPVPCGFGGLGEPHEHEHLDERFNEALLTSSTTLSTARLAPISHGSRRTTSSTSRTSPSTACWAGLGRLPAGLQLTTWIWTWMWRPCRARTRPGCTAHAPARAAAERLQPSDHPPPPPHPTPHPTVCASVRSASGEIRESVVRRHAVCHL